MPRNIFENEEVLSIGEFNPEAAYTPVESIVADPTAQAGVRSDLPRHGLATPPTVQAMVGAESGELTGLLGSFGSGFDGGLIGQLFSTPAGTKSSLGADLNIERSIQRYGEENPIKDFIGQAGGRFIADSPIDFALGLGVTKVGLGISQAMRARGVSPSAVKKFEKAMQISREQQGNPGIWSGVYRDSVEGLLAGVASESILQSMGQRGGVEDVIKVGIQDAVASPFFGAGLRGLGKITGWSKDTFIKDTSKSLSKELGVPKKDIKDALEEEISIIAPDPELEPDEITITGDSLTPEERLASDLEGQLQLETLRQQEALVRLEEAELDRQDQAINDRLDEEFNKVVEARRLERGQANAQRRIDQANAEKRRLQGIIDEGKVRRQKFLAEMSRDTQEFRAKQEQEYLDDLVRDALFIDFELNRALQDLRKPDPEGQAALPAGAGRGERLLGEGVPVSEQRAGYRRFEEDNMRRKLLGSSDDLAEISNETGIPVDELLTLRERAFQLMREDQRGMDLLGDLEPELNPRAEVTSPPRIDEPKEKSAAEVMGAIHVSNAQQLVDMFMHFGRGVEGTHAYAKAMLSMFRVRAANAGKTLNEYLNDKALRYIDSEGESHIIFNDAETIIRGVRDAEDLGDLFHEIGHVIEQDLTMAERKLLANKYFPKNKGKLREVNLFGRDFSERFANDFVTYLDDVFAGRRSDLDEGLKGLFNKIARWMKEVTNSLLGTRFLTGPMSPEVQGVFDRLFRPGERVDLELGRKQFRDRAVAARRGDVELAATPSEKLTKAQREKAERLSYVADNAEEVQANIRALADDGGEIENSPLAKSTIWAKAREWMPKVMTSGVMTMRTLLENLGPTGDKIYQKLRQGKMEEQRIQKKNYDSFRKASENHGFTKEDWNKLNESEKAKDLQVTLGGKDRAMGANELINLHLMANDGVRVGKDAEKRSARLALGRYGYELEGTKGPIVLSQDEISDLASESYLEQTYGPEFVRAARTIKQTMKEVGGRRAQWMKDNMGNAGFDPETEYFPKKARAVPGEEKLAMVDDFGERINILEATDEELYKALQDASKNTSKEKLMMTIADVISSNRTRKGGGIIQYQNPFDTVSRYLDEDARLLGMAEPLAEWQVTLNNAFVREKLNTHVGEDITKTLDLITKNIVGLRDRTAPYQDNKWGNRLYKGRVLSALSWNLSPIFKQLPAIMTSLSRLDLPEGTSRVAMATRLLKESIGKRKELHEEMKERFPTYAMRYTNSGVSPDMSDVNLASHAKHVLFDDISLSEGFKGGIGEGVTNAVEVGMRGVREADAATIRAVYLAATESLEKQGKLEGLDDAAKDQMIEELASEIIDETQGASHSLNRTVSQNTDNFFERQIAMFSSEPTQQFNMLLRDINKLRQLPDGPEKEAIRKRLKTTGNMLLFNAMGVAAAGTAAGTVKQEGMDLLNSEEYQQRRDQYLENMGLEYGRLKGQLIDSTAGILPYSGSFLGEFLKATMIGENFDQELMPFGLLNDINDMASNENVKLSDIVKNVGNLLNLAYGVPGTLTQAATSTVR